MCNIPELIIKKKTGYLLHACNIYMYKYICMYEVKYNSIINYPIILPV